MTDINESNKSFLGLLLYAGSHLFCIYYLLWILIHSILDYRADRQQSLSQIQEEIVSFSPYFPASKYRIVLPIIFFGAFVLFSIVSYLIMVSKRREMKKILNKQ